MTDSVYEACGIQEMYKMNLSYFVPENRKLSKTNEFIPKKWRNKIKRASTGVGNNQ
jgi:hypothetical protein